MRRLGSLQVHGPLVQRSPRVQAPHHQAGAFGLADDHDLCRLVLVLLPRRSQGRHLPVVVLVPRGGRSRSWSRFRDRCWSGGGRGIGVGLVGLLGGRRRRRREGCRAGAPGAALVPWRQAQGAQSPQGVGRHGGDVPERSGVKSARDAGHRAVAGLAVHPPRGGGQGRRARRRGHDMMVVVKVERGRGRKKRERRRDRSLSLRLPFFCPLFLFPGSRPLCCSLEISQLLKLGL